MLAYRFTRPDGVVVADNDDDGEHGAGRVLAHLVEMMTKDRGRKLGKKKPKKKGRKSKKKEKGAAAAGAAASTAAGGAGAVVVASTANVAESKELEKSATGAAVAVSRWYGGTHLGPARFKHISNSAREVLERAGFGGD